MENEQLRSKCAQEEAEYEKEYQVAKGMRKIGVRPADHLLPVMIDETGRTLKDDEVFNELAKPIWQRNAMICIGDDCQRYTSWQEGK